MRARMRRMLLLPLACTLPMTSARSLRSQSMACRPGRTRSLVTRRAQLCTLLQPLVLPLRLHLAAMATQPLPPLRSHIRIRI